MSHPFRFDVDTAIQAAAFLLRREASQRMNYMRLLKLLYIVERESLKESSKPLTGSTVVAMQRGPVLQDVLSLIRGQHFHTPEWAKFLRTDHYHLELIDDPGVGQLSRFITRKLEEVAQRHDQHDEWDMVEITHKLPEWIKNDPGESSKPIPVLDILSAIGRENDLNAILEGARQDANAYNLFHTRN